MPKAFLKSKYFKSLAHVKNHLTYLDKQSMLFSPVDDVALPDALASVDACSQSTMWRHLYSMTVEDCQRLSVDREYLKTLIAAKRDSIARAYNINPKNLVLFASFHAKDHHPHLHIVMFSTDKREGHIHCHKEQDQDRQLADASRRLKSVFANEIFKGDLQEIKVNKAAQRTQLNQQIQKNINRIVETKAGYWLNPKIQTELQELSVMLRDVSGKKVYGYLPPTVKKKVDSVLETILANDKTAAELYAVYAQSQQELIGTYVESPITLAEKMKEWESSFISPSKGEDAKRHNMIVNAAMYLVAKSPEKQMSIDHLNEQQEETASNIEDGTSLDNEGDASTDAATNRPKKRHNQADNKSSSTTKWTEEYVEARNLLYGTEDIELDIFTAYRLMQVEALKGNAYAMQDLAKMYMSGQLNHGIPNAELAQEWYKKALDTLLSIEENNPSAGMEYKIGKMYHKGLGTETDIEKAAQWYLKSAEKNNSYAQYSLGCLYRDGALKNEQGTPEINKKEAYYWLEKSAEQNNTSAQYQLSLMILGDDEKSEESRKKALDTLQKLADDGDVKFQYRLGIILLNGQGVPQDIPKALALLTKAANQNHQNAQYKLGMAMLNPLLVNPPNIGNGIHWLTKSMEQGNSNAAYQLGKLYLNEKLVQKNVGMALKYFTAASNMGNANALYEIAKIYLYDPELQNESLGESLLHIAAERGSTGASQLIQKRQGYIFKSVGDLTKNLVWNICKSLNQQEQQNQSRKKAMFNAALRNKKLKKVTHRQNREENVYERE